MFSQLLVLVQYYDQTFLAPREDSYEEIQKPDKDDFCTWNLKENERNVSCPPGQNQPTSLK